MAAIKNWSAKRAGRGITITGEKLDGQPIKVTTDGEIRAGRPYPVVRDKAGVLHELWSAL